MRKKVIWIVALLTIAGAIGYLALGGIGENLVYYWSPTELMAAGDKAYGATVRLGGQVTPGSVQWNAKQKDLRFSVTDGKTQVKVHAKAVPPQMFRDGIGIVIEGHYQRGGIFEGTRLLVKHSNEYKAPKAGKHRDVEAMMKTVVDSPGRTTSAPR